MINLLYCGNSKVFDGVMTSLLSIFKRAKKDDVYNVTIFTMSLVRVKVDYTPISDELISYLDEFVKRYSPLNSVRKVDVTDFYETYFKLCPNESAYCSPYTLIRLFADLVPDMPDKFLYLDTDTMFNDDIHLLYDIDINEYEYAASNDHYGKFLVNPRYINAGVLLFNLKKDKETHLFEKARHWIQTKKLVFADQSALIRSTTHFKLLSQRFNDQRFLYKKTVIRHFSKRLYYLPYPHTANIKQYMIDEVHNVLHYHQFDDIYEEYLKIKKEYMERVNGKV